MGREKAETRRARENARYANDPEYRAKIKAERKAYYQDNKEIIKARTKAWREANPRYNRNYFLMKNYGLTPEQWDARLIAQSGRCAICSEPMLVPCLDHCHAGGENRDLLCSSCNIALGYFKDDPERILAAADYLQRHRLLV